jgi:hypothetical protein
MIQEFEIKENIANRLINKLDTLKNDNEGIESNSSCTINGFQTNNLCYETSMQEVLNEILEYIPIKNLKYRWFHMIDYDNHGMQQKHNHIKTEHYSFILYLTTCKNGGETVFEINKNQIQIKPEKNKLIFFPSDLWHWGNETFNKKKIAVGALIF